MIGWFSAAVIGAFRCSTGKINDACLNLCFTLYFRSPGHCYARVLFTDFSKGFDFVDHNILCTELRNLGVPGSDRF